MSGLIEALRWVNLVVWSALLAYMLLRGAISALGHKPRRGDPMRLGVALVALIFVLGFGRWIFAPDNQSAYLAVHVLSIGVGLYVTWLARSYGRGNHV